MARRLKTFDFSKRSTITPSNVSRRYPWDEWFDGDIWELTYGEDFDAHPLMMERIIRVRANSPSRKAKLNIRHAELNGKAGRAFQEPIGRIIIQRIDVKGPAEQAKEKRSAAAKKAAETRRKNAEK